MTTGGRGIEEEWTKRSAAKSPAATDLRARATRLGGP